MSRASPSTIIRESPRHRTCMAMRQWIERGILVAGQPLPSERALCERAGVSRSVIRHVVPSLISEGLIVEDAAGNRSVRPSGFTSQPINTAILGSTIAILTPDPTPSDLHGRLARMEQMAQGAIDGSRDAGCDVLAIHSDRLRNGGMERLLAAPPLGVVVPEPFKPIPNLESWLRQLRAAGVAVAVYGGAPELADFDRVMSDHDQGSYELTRWLISRGRKRILNLWGKPGNYYWNITRRQGYERAMQEAGLEALPTVLFTPLPRNSPDAPPGDPKGNFEIKAYQLAGHLAPWIGGADPVDAIMLTNDGDVPPAASALRILGKESGREVLITGYDNQWGSVPEQAWEATPPAASMDKCNFKIGQEMVRLLMDRAAGRLPQDPQCRVVKPKMVFFEGNKADGV